MHAKEQAHAPVPAIHVNVGQQDELDKALQTAEKSKEEALPWDRFRIVHLQTSKDKRVVGDIKVAVYGKVSQEQKFIPSTATKLTGGWVKVIIERPRLPVSTRSSRLGEGRHEPLCVGFRCRSGGWRQRHRVEA